MCGNVEELLKFLEQHHVVLRTWWWRKRHHVCLNYGLFAPKTVRSRERKFQVWNFRSLELSHPGTFAPTKEYSKELILLLMTFHIQLLQKISEV